MSGVVPKRRPTADVHITEIPLAVFVLFFRMNLWFGDMKARSAAAGVSIVELAFLFGCADWLEIATHERFSVNPWLLGVLGLALYLANDRFFVDKRHGTEFERKFRAFPRNKKIALYSTAGIIVVAVSFFFYTSLEAYHRAFSPL